MPALAPHYQLDVTRDGHLDKLDRHVELRRSSDARRTSESGLARDSQHRIKTHVGVSTEVNVLAAGGIERTVTGKAARRRQAPEGMNEEGP